MRKYHWTPELCLEKSCGVAAYGVTACVCARFSRMNSKMGWFPDTATIVGDRHLFAGCDPCSWAHWAGLPNSLQPASVCRTNARRASETRPVYGTRAAWYNVGKLIWISSGSCKSCTNQLSRVLDVPRAMGGLVSATSSRADRSICVPAVHGRGRGLTSTCIAGITTLRAK